jgi:NTP pyrophosphatase (non-canonical NTP hydrolase)
LSAEQALHRLIEEIAELVKPVLLYDREKIEWSLPDIFAWLCAFTNHFKVDLEEMMIKYLKSPPGKPKEAQHIQPRDIIGKDEPETLEDWQRYLSIVYLHENENIPPDLMISKIVEDVGLTSRNLRTRKDTDQIKESLAGAFAWAIALANKFQVKLDDAIYEKYPNYCFKCRNKPCRCFRLSTIFIGYTKDTDREMNDSKNLIEQDLKLKVEVFGSLGPRFHRLRMVEAFNAINRSDGAVVLLKACWSENVWAELIEILKTIDENNVWIYVSKTRKRIDPELVIMLKDIEHFHQIRYYSTASQLKELLKAEIEKRLRELRRLDRRSPQKESNSRQDD